MTWKRPGLRKGSHLVVDDLTGFTIWSHDAVKRWDGLIVHRNQHEARHPQDTIRVPREDMRVPDARPRPIDQFVGPLMTVTTASSAAGTVTLEVLHTERMAAGDQIGVYLDSGDLHRGVIDQVTDLTHLVLTAVLPGRVASGAKVIDYSAVAV